MYAKVIVGGAGQEWNMRLPHLSPDLFFQCHTASEPVLGDLSARVPSLPRHTLVIPGYGDKPLLPSQGAFKPSQLSCKSVFTVRSFFPPPNVPIQFAGKFWTFFFHWDRGKCLQSSFLCCSSEDLWAPHRELGSVAGCEDLGRTPHSGIYPISLEISYH